MPLPDPAIDPNAISKAPRSEVTPGEVAQPHQQIAHLFDQVGDTLGKISEETATQAGIQAGRNPTVTRDAAGNIVVQDIPKAPIIGPAAAAYRRAAYQTYVASMTPQINDKLTQLQIAAQGNPDTFQATAKGFIDGVVKSAPNPQLGAALATHATETASQHYRGMAIADDRLNLENFVKSNTARVQQLDEESTALARQLGPGYQDNKEYQARAAERRQLMDELVADHRTKFPRELADRQLAEAESGDKAESIVGDVVRKYQTKANAIAAKRELMDRAWGPGSEDMHLNRRQRNYIVTEGVRALDNISSENSAEIKQNKANSRKFIDEGVKAPLSVNSDMLGKMYAQSEALGDWESMHALSVFRDRTVPNLKIALDAPTSERPALFRRIAAGEDLRNSSGATPTSLIDHIASHEDNPLFNGTKPVSNAYHDYKTTSVGFGSSARSPTESLTREQAMERLQSELPSYAKRVEDFAPNAPPGVKAALTSLSHNLGFAWMTSGLGKAVQAGDWAEAKNRFLQYTKAGEPGEPLRDLPGLIRRRNEEAQWFPGGGMEGGPGSEAATPVSRPDPNAPINKTPPAGFYFDPEFVHQNLQVEAAALSQNKAIAEAGAKKIIHTLTETDDPVTEGEVRQWADIAKSANLDPKMIEDVKQAFNAQGLRAKTIQAGQESAGSAIIEQQISQLKREGVDPVTRDSMNHVLAGVKHSMEAYRTNALGQGVTEYGLGQLNPLDLSSPNNAVAEIKNRDKMARLINERNRETGPMSLIMPSEAGAFKAQLNAASPDAVAGFFQGMQIAASPENFKATMTSEHMPEILDTLIHNSDPKKLNAGFSVLDKLQNDDPNGFVNKYKDERLKELKTWEAWKVMSTPEDLVKRLNSARDPTQTAARKSAEEEAHKELTKITTDDMATAMGTSGMLTPASVGRMMGWDPRKPISSTGDTPQDAPQDSAFRADWTRLYSDYRQGWLDQTQATKATAQRMNTLWGKSEANDGQLMRHPPEMSPLNGPINGSHAWMRDQLEQDIAKIKGERVTELAGATGEFGQVGARENWKVSGILSDKRTESEMSNGYKPSYLAVIEKADGTRETLPQRIYFDRDQALLDYKRGFATRRTEALKNRVENFAVDTP